MVCLISTNSFLFSLLFIELLLLYRRTVFSKRLEDTLRFLENSFLFPDSLTSLRVAVLLVLN